MKKKLYLFDMDGTLLDSMHVWSDIDKRFISKHHITAPDDFSEKIASMTLPECADYFIELGVKKSEGASLEFTVEHIGPCTGSIEVNESISYDDKNHYCDSLDN